MTQPKTPPPYLEPFSLPSPSSAPFHLHQAQLSGLGTHYTRYLPLPTPDTYSIYLVHLSVLLGGIGAEERSAHLVGAKVTHTRLLRDRIVGGYMVYKAAKEEEEGGR
ncbi:hypothetical protein GE21DRAFT_1289387 [Neurospora crassa]|nr:hypothetical protein GE21DRAFT_1289387 [Neurospora crassa]